MPSSAVYPFGLTPIPRDPAELKPSTSSPPHLALEQLQATIPDTPLVKAAIGHLKPLLPVPIWNHSHRAYLHGVAAAMGVFPDWHWDPESFYLSCLFHDLAAIPDNLKKTRLSFETYGAILAREFLLNTAPNPSQQLRDLADSVGEAIARHTDLNVGGKATTHVVMIQLGTLADNIGLKSEWYHPETTGEIAKAYPRFGWTMCFHDAMKDEIAHKPWAHTTFFDADGVWDKVKANPVAAVFEGEEAKAGVHP